MAGYQRLNETQETEKKLSAIQCACSCCCCLFFGIGALSTAMSHNMSCNYLSVKDLAVPSNGDIIPKETLMIEQQGWFQFTKKVDVYSGSDTSKQIGTFFDMNFLLWMRFGYADADDNVWFEATYPSFFSRFKFNIEYQLQRCDSDAGLPMSTYFLKEDWWKKSWFCWSSCRRSFDITRLPDDSAEGGEVAVAHVEFDSHLTSLGYASMRQAWFMNLTDIADNSQAATAQQHFFWGGKLGWSMLSNWTVEVYEPTVPNWVVSFMAALDDVEEKD